MWFEERSWSNLKLTDDLIEDWRDLWPCKIEFFVIILSYLWATTNFLNLPKLILENGGLAFVVAYCACLFVIALPILTIEFSVGQLVGRAPVRAFGQLSPIFKGVGIAQLLFSFVFVVMTTRFLGWLELFFFHDFWAVFKGRPSLPWLSCRLYPELISEPCREAGSLANFTHDAHTKFATVQAESSLMQFMGALEKPSPSIDIIGNLELFPAVAYGIIWITVFCTICFGVRWIGKVLPMAIFCAFASFCAVLIRSLALDGAFSSLNYWYAQTNWEVLMDYMVWKRAAEQVLLATGVGFGAYITLASYCKRSNNLVKDVFGITLMHLLFSSLQVLLVIALTGHVYKKTGIAPNDLIDRGENQMWHILSYIAAIPIVKLWSALLLLTAILTLFCVFCILTLSILAGIEDAFGEKASRCFPRFVLAFLVCTACGGASLIFATQAGKHAYELTTGYLQYGTLWFIMAAQLIVVSYFYCSHRLGMDLRAMLRSTCCFCVGYTTLLPTYLLPAVPIAILYFNVREYNKFAFSDAVKSWPWYECVGLAIAIVPILPIPIYALCAILRVCCCGKAEDGSSFKQLFGNQVRPHEEYSRYQPPVHHANITRRADTASPPRYASAAPGYLRLPQAPLAEPESYNEVGYSPFLLSSRYYPR